MRSRYYKANPVPDLILVWHAVCYNMFSVLAGVLDWVKSLSLRVSFIFKCFRSRPF